MWVPVRLWRRLPVTGGKDATTLAERESRVRVRRQRQHRRLLQSELPRALTSGEIYVVYQPKFNLRDGCYDGVETLIRWQHPSLGQIDPGSLIVTAEESGQIHALSRWVLTQAVADQRVLMKRWPMRFHINISGKSLGSDKFVDDVCELARSAAERIGFEITETAFIANPPAALANLDRLVAAGIAISIDDYGSGHSSLAYLKELPADELKIDKLFVSGMTSSNRDPLIVRSTIDLAHALGMRVVAEGVESRATLALLRVMGCDVAQGYFISPPLRLDVLQRFMEDDTHLKRLNDTDISLTPSRAFWTRAERERGAGTINAAPQE